MFEIDHFHSALNLNFLVTFFQKAVIQRQIEILTWNQSHNKNTKFFRIWKKLINTFDQFWVIKVWKSDVCDNRNFEIFGSSLSRYKWRSLLYCFLHLLECWMRPGGVSLAQSLHLWETFHNVNGLLYIKHFHLFQACCVLLKLNATESRINMSDSSPSPFQTKAHTAALYYLVNQT